MPFWTVRNASVEDEVAEEGALVPESEAKALKGRIRELERLLGRKTLENEILKDAIEVAREKKLLSRPPLPKRDDSR